MQGYNSVIMVGFISNPKIMEIREGNYKYTAKIGIPINKTNENGEEIRISYNIVAWGTTAEALAELGEGMPIKITGRLNVRSYKSKCRHCGGELTKYWTDILVNSFMVVTEDGGF